MQTIETKVKIGDDRRLSVQLPPDIMAGEYEVVLILNQSFRAMESLEISVTPEITAIEKIQSLLRQSIGPSYSLADELIRERHEAANHE